MPSIRLRERLLASTIVAGAVIASPALAQNVQPGQGATPNAPVIGGSAGASSVDPSNSTDASGNTGDTGAIVVTGSRISNPSLTSTSPLTVVSGAEAKLQGTTRVEDLLNSLPQVFASEGSTDANGASGIATVDLRDLGPVRTLVLINGKRVVPGDPLDPATDLNFIPAQLIQRIDVLTGGASSIYGSDALAGVVNFVLNKDFSGFQIDAQYSLYNHDNDVNSVVTDALKAHNYAYPSGNTADGFQKSISATFGAGTDDGRGHVTVYGTWRKVAAVTQGDRDFSACGLSGSNDGVAGDLFCGGSSTAANGRIRTTYLEGTAAGKPIYGTTNPATGNPSTSYSVNPNTANSFRIYSAGRDAFNFNPYNYFQRPDERYTLGGFAHYQVSDAFDPYLEVMFMDDRTTANIAPSGAFYGTDFFINCNNPLLSGTQQTQLCGANAGTGTLQSVYIGRRNVEGGSRIDDLRHTDYRIVTGAKGDIARGISYDAYGEFSRAIFSERYENDFSRARLNNSLNVVNSANGPVCASAVPNAQGVVTDPNCVPYNIFTPGGVTQAALNYLQTPGFKEGQTTEYVASGSITAQLGEYGIQSPFADTGVGLAIGAEYRRESLEEHNDVEFQTGDLAGQGTPFGVSDEAGGYHVKEGFAELEVPLVSNKPFAQTLSLNASYRYSDYNTAGSTNTYKGGAQWAPVKDILFRGDYSRAVRAPNILELFSTPTVGLFPSNGDPCAGAMAADGTVNGNTFAQCARSGVTAAEFGKIDASPANQYNQRTSGNAALKPEIADTYTAGIVLQPRFLRNFVLTVDGYDIKIKGLIGTFGADFTLSQCVATGNPLFCDRVNRATGSGALFVGNAFVDNPTQNLGSEKTRGIDVNASYKYNTDKFGSFGFDLVGTYLDKFEVQQLPGALSVGKYNCAGYFGSTCGTPLPKWRSKFRVTWTAPDGIQLSGAWRYFGHVKNDLDSSNPLLGGGPGTAASEDATPRIKAVSYFDLSSSVRVADKFTFRIGAQNILDKQPPLSFSPYSTNGSNTYAQVYDSLGRYIYAGVTLDL